ncbi:MAG TPA: tetratricopeptide repeat protein [Salinivirga sp.]|uniref:tetratricopeptide repeat-containing sensor histidine kinase n=1 Tax=Salinivirga sp. TaxID=1970192 RepID=UPI002B490EB3|nr:tetratricopeptide repeat protein [Salinivirga sp.]HKK59424.1 tetratricopeptide repeat protein [Salinivirga sp.]
MKTILQIVLLFLFSFHFCSLYGQNRKADSLALLLSQHQKTDTIRVKLLNNLGYSLYLTNTDTVKVLAEEALSLSEHLDYDKGKARSLRLMGLHYDMKANYPLALDFYQRSLTISEKIDDKKGISDCLNSIGVIYSDQENYKQAEEYYVKSLEIFQELDDKRGESFTLNNLGVIYYEQKNLEKALEYFKKSLVIDKELGIKGGVGIGLNNIGEVYRDTGEYDSALTYLNNALELTIEIKDIYGQSYLYKDLASVYYLQKNYKQALEYAELSLEYALYNDYFDIQKDVYLQLSKIHAALNNYKKAYNNHVVHKRLNDSIYNEKNLEKTIGLEYHYKYEKEREEARLLQEEELKRQKLIRNSLIVGIILLLIFIIIIVRGWVQKSRINKLLSQKTENIQNKSLQLQEQNEEIQQLYEELSAANEVLFTQKEELEKHRNNLESLVKERTMELERAKDKAEESDRLKSAFLANMSHEIRTPLNAIIGFSDLLADPDIDQQTKNELHSNMNHSNETLLKLIDDIFDIAKIESGQLSIKKEHVAVSDLLGKLIPVYEDKKEKMGKSDISITICQSNNDLVLYTDPFRLQQIFINLIDNALKFTESGFVEVSCDKDKFDGRKVVFFVKDSGIGMNQKQIDYIFDRFIKLEENTTKIYRGAGLGLAISKNIVELLGGELWVESEIGKGSTFYFSIPV